MNEKEMLMKQLRANAFPHNNGKVMQALNDAVQATVIGDKTPAQALKDAQQQADEALAPYSK